MFRRRNHELGCFLCLPKRNLKAAAFCVLLLPGILEMAALIAGMTSAVDDSEAGFAKLQGEDFEYFMQTYSIILGRSTKKEKVDLDFSMLGGGLEVSRRHARIFYDFQRRRFSLEVLGKNGCLVEGVLHLPGGILLNWTPRTSFRLGRLNSTFSYQLALSLPPLLLGILLLHHKPRLHPLCGLATLIHLISMSTPMVTIMSATMVTKGLELALKHKGNS